jgi:hypothetical protein
MIAFIAPIRAGIQTDKYLFDGGYVRSNATTGNFSFFYYNKDHLGNNREVLDHWITGSVLMIIFQDRQSINGNVNETSNELQ